MRSRSSAIRHGPRNPIRTRSRCPRRRRARRATGRRSRPGTRPGSRPRAAPGPRSARKDRGTCRAEHPRRSGSTPGAPRRPARRAGWRSRRRPRPTDPHPRAAGPVGLADTNSRLMRSPASASDVPNSAPSSTTVREHVVEPRRREEEVDEPGPAISTRSTCGTAARRGRFHLRGDVSRRPADVLDEDERDGRVPVAVLARLGGVTSTPASGGAGRPAAASAARDGR